MTPTAPTTPAEQVRERIIMAALELLEAHGRDAVTTRAVAAATPVRAPTIYRLFGDKDGLLAALAEHGYRAFLEGRIAHDEWADPVDDLRVGWDLAVQFGLDNPELYSLIYVEASPGRMTEAMRTGAELLGGRIKRVAAAGRLRVDEPVAAAVIQATARGAVLTCLSLPDESSRPDILATLREAMVTAVTTDDALERRPDRASAARTLRAHLSGQAELTDHEALLLTDWLDRLGADSRRQRRRDR